MFHKRAKNIIINRVNRENPDTRLTSDDNLIKLAAYYTKVYAETLDSMHISAKQKREAVAAVNREYNELLSAYGCMDKVS